MFLNSKPVAMVAQAGQAEETCFVGYFEAIVLIVHAVYDWFQERHPNARMLIVY